MLEARSSRSSRKNDNRSEGYFRACFEMAPEPLLLHSGGKILYVNRAAVEVGRASGKEDLIGHSILEFVDPADHERVVTRIERMERTGERMPPFDVRLNLYDHVTLDVEIASTPLDLPEGRIIQTAIRDVSERKRMSQKLRESEERYRSLVAMMPAAVYTCDADGYITYFNEQAARLWGRRPDIGEHGTRLCGSIRLWKLDGTELDFEASPMADAVYSGKTTYRGEPVVIERPDGSRITVAVNIAPLRGADGERMGAVNVLTDITSRQEAEGALEESERKFRTLVESSPAGIYIIRHERFLYVNRAFAGFLGRTPEELTAMPTLLEMIADEDRDRVRENLRRRMSGEIDSVHYELKALHADGSTVDLEVLGATITYQDQRTIIGTALDITETRNTREALRRSERFLDSVVENLPVQVFVKDAEELRFVRLNRVTEEALGLRSDDLVGRTDYDVFPVEIANWFRKQDRKVLDERRLLDIPEEQIWTEQHGPRYLHTRKIPILDDDGMPAYLLGIAEDITEQRLADEHLRVSESRYHALSQLLLSYGFSYAIDAEGNRTVEWVTDSMEQVFGYTAEEMKDVEWHALIHPDDVDTYRRYSERLLNNEATEAQFRAIRKDGSARWIRAVGFPERNEDEQRVVRVYGAGQDITAQKEIELELVRQKERAEEMTRLKDAFLANMSHEIRTPLAAIIGASDILSGEAVDVDSELVDFIRRGGERLMDTLNSVLDLAQLEGGTVELQCGRVDLRREVQQVAQTFEPSASQRGLFLKVSVAGDGPVEARADRAALGRALSNVMSNAIKFTYEGGIQVRVRREAHEVVIEIEDTGIGIGEEFLPHVFDEFRQESSGHARDFEGNGLGLTITKRLIELMGGEVEVNSILQAGTTFSFRLPAFEAQNGTDVHKSDDAEPVTGAMTLLVVDDDPVVRSIAEAMLSEHHEVHVAEGAEEAVRLARMLSPEGIFLDINLRGRTGGVEVMQRLRSVPALVHTRIIALTAYALPGDEQRFLDAGFDGYISKPFRKKDLLRPLRESVAG